MALAVLNHVWTRPPMSCWYWSFPESDGYGMGTPLMGQMLFIVRSALGSPSADDQQPGKRLPAVFVVRSRGWPYSIAPHTPPSRFPMLRQDSPRRHAESPHLIAKCQCLASDASRRPTWFRSRCPSTATRNAAASPVVQDPESAAIAEIRRALVRRM